MSEKPPMDPKELQRRVASGEISIDWATNTRGVLMYEIPRVLFDISAAFVSDGSHLSDFCEPIGEEVRERAREAWGIEIPDDSEQRYLWCIADLIMRRKSQ